MRCIKQLNKWHKPETGERFMETIIEMAKIGLIGYILYAIIVTLATAILFYYFIKSLKE